MNELVSRFAQDRQDLLDTLKDFPADRVEEVAFGKWNLRCLVAHLAGWDGFFTELVKLLRAGSKVPYWGEIDAFNEASVQARADWTWKKVYDEFVSAGEAFIAEYGSLEEELWDRRFWAQGPVTPGQIVEINIHHYEGHLAKIVERLAEWGG